MKITVDELNHAYLKVNEFKINGYPIRDSIDIFIERNPLIENDDEVNARIKLTFEADYEIGPKGSYILTSDIDIIDVY